MHIYPSGQSLRKLGGCLLAIGAAFFCLPGWLGWDAPGFARAGGFITRGDRGKNIQNSSETGFARRVFVNEIHYDNSGADSDEGVEVTGPAGTDLSGWRIVFYNGNGGGVYAALALAGVLPDLEAGFGCSFFPLDGLQNGSPDAIALVNPHGMVVQFLSYEGVVAAAGGPATGFLSEDIGVEEDGADPAGLSIQLRGTGNADEDFTWSGPIPATPGDANAGQTFLPATPAAAPQITKFAPAYVAPGGLITYTLAIQNLLGYPLHQVAITDAVPSGATFAYALDGGQVTNGVVRWEVDRLEHGASIERRWAAAAPLEPQHTVANLSYSVTALEWITPAAGAVVYTTVGEYTPIYAIQGSGTLSPWRGRPVKTRGVVTGFLQGNYPDGSSFNGFFLQDLAGDADPQTSDGLFVFNGNRNVAVSQGDFVEVSGMVEEFDEYAGMECPGEACLTVVSIAGSASVRTLGSGAVLSAPLDPPGDPALAAIYFEGREGLVVDLAGAARVTGPTSFGTLSILPGDEGVERVLRGSPQEGMTFGLRHWERSGDINGQNAPGLVTGSTAAAFHGPLTFSYGDYLVITQPGEAWRVIDSRPPPGSAPTWPAPAAGEFSVATYNTDKLNGWGIQYTKVISGILSMHGPTILALQEVNPNTVFPDLAVRLETWGVGYEYAFSHPDAGGYGVALLWRTEYLKEVRWSAQYQACSPYGSPSSTFDALWDTCRERGEYPLFARRPVVISGTLQSGGSSLPLVVIANHFKSRLEGESAEQRRLEEAQFVGKLAGELAKNGFAQVVVLGDLNDFEDSLPLQALYSEGGLANTWDRVPPENHFSFIYQGVSQVLDHILVTPGLLSRLEAAAPLHLNADFPYSPYARDSHAIWHASDHDPVAALFRLNFIDRVYLPLIILKR